MTARSRTWRTTSYAASVVGFGLPVAACVVLALSLPADSPGGPAGRLLGYGTSLDGGPGTASAAKHTFRISGGVQGLYPGAVRSLRLTVTNPNGTRITVDSVRTTVSTTSTACGAKSITVSSFSGSASVPAHGSRTITVKARMSRAAPNGCKGARYVLHYTGSASQG